MTLWQEFARRYCGKTAVMALFLLLAFPVVVLTAVITPPSQSPDEVAHYARALGLLHGAVLGQRRIGTDTQTGKAEMQSGVKVELGLLRASAGMSTVDITSCPVDARQHGGKVEKPERRRNFMDPASTAACFPTAYLPDVTVQQVETRQDWDKIEAIQPDTRMVFINLANTVTYFPTAYLPATLGVALARLFGSSPIHGFITARLFMAAAFLLVGLAALYVAAYGEALLVTVLLLPMTLFLGGTLNQDGPLIAMTCLAAACLTRAARPWRLAGLVVFALVLGAKPPYILLMGVFALPLFAPGFWRRFADMALVMLPVLAWTAYIALFVVVPYGKAQYFPGALYTGNHGVPMDHANAAAQWQILMARPRRFLALPYWTTLLTWYPDYLEVIGVLGPLLVLLDTAVYHGWGIALALAMLGLLVTRRPEVTPPLRALVNACAVMGAILVTCWLLYIIFYLDWTNVGWTYIEGIQGRYLLIFLPFLLFAVPHMSALPGLRRVRFALPPLVLAAPALVMAGYDAGYIPLKLVLHYYLH